MKKLFLLLSVVLIVLTSCSSGDETDEVITPVGTRLKKYIHWEPEGNGYIFYSSKEYFYNGDKLDYTINESGYQTRYYYTGNLITRKIFFTGETTDYTYDSQNRLVLSDNYSNSGSISHNYTDYVYHSNGMVEVTSYYFDASNVQHITGTKMYSFQNGNIVSANGLNYSYDTNNSPFKNILGYDKFIIADSFYMSTNNCLMVTYPSSPPGSYEEKNSYVYNLAGYPTQKYTLYSGTSWSVKYEYFYE